MGRGWALDFGSWRSGHRKHEEPQRSGRENAGPSVGQEQNSGKPRSCVAQRGKVRQWPGAAWTGTRAQTSGEGTRRHTESSLGLTQAEAPTSVSTVPRATSPSRRGSPDPLPAQGLQPVDGDRQGGDRRQPPGRWRAQQRPGGPGRHRRGAASEKQAAAVRGLWAQLHGGAGLPGSRSVLRVCGSKFNATPRFRDAAAAGRRRGRGSSRKLRARLSPREARWAGGRNPKTKSKQVWLVQKGSGRDPRSDPLTLSTFLTLLLLCRIGGKLADLHLPTLQPKWLFAVLAASKGPPLPAPLS